MKVVFAPLVVLLAVCFPHCFSSEHEHGPNSEAVEKIVQGNNKLALKMLNVLGNRITESQSGNLFFSPTSISVAFGMLFLGSRGKTAAQIAETFNWDVQEFEDIHTAFKGLHEEIHNSEPELLELRLANRLWGHKELELMEEFKQGTRDFYNSEVALADFVKSSEAARTAVNNWVHEHTGGKIKDFIPHGVFNSATRLALINVIYFKGVWKSEFDERKTFHAPFFMQEPHEMKIEVEMMSRTFRPNYYHDIEEKCQILELPYSGNKLSMVIVLPEDYGGIAEIERSLTAEKLEKWVSLLQTTTVQVSLPRFRLSHQFELKNVLPELGIKDLFDANLADLSGITARGGLFVSNVIHRAHVEVNERGTEAAAATGVVMMKRSLDMNEAFHADHPFLFFICHKHTGAILFLGKVMQPSRVGDTGDLDTTRSPSDEL